MSYTILDNSVLEDERLTIQQKMVLVSIISYYNKKWGYANPSYIGLKKRSSIKDDRTLIKAINYLEENNYIRKEVKKGVGTRYYLLENYSNRNNTVPVELQDVPTVILQDDLLENYSTTNTNINTNINTINIPHQEDVLTDKIWKLYPNKKGKTKAVDRIQKLIKEYGYEQIETCVKRYSKEVEGRDKQYIKQGDTFFNKAYADYLDENYECDSDSIEYCYEEDPETGEIIKRRV